MNKSTKKVEFSNKVTEQIIPESIEGVDDIKQDPVVKEVDFDIKFLDRHNENSNDAKKNTKTPPSNSKTTTAKSAANTTTTKPTKSASKSPPPPKVKSAPVTAKNAKGSSKDKSSAKEVTTASSVEEVPVDIVDEIKVNSDPFARVKLRIIMILFIFDVTFKFNFV